MLGSRGLLNPIGVAGAGANALFGETTSQRIARLAGKELERAGSLTDSQISELCGSALTQRPNHLSLMMVYVHRVEHTGEQIGRLAARGLHYPSLLSHSERRSVAASALTQVQNKH
jgi:hypothetical protein